MSNRHFLYASSPRFWEAGAEIKSHQVFHIPGIIFKLQIKCKIYNTIHCKQNTKVPKKMYQYTIFLFSSLAEKCCHDTNENDCNSNIC